MCVSQAGDRLLRGGFGVAGELGHMRIVPDGILCGCGARGCGRGGWQHGL